MAEIVNFNKIRKAKARSDKEKRAAQNRIEYGTPKGLKDVEAANKALVDKKLAGKKLEPDGADDADPQNRK